MLNLRAHFTNAVIFAMLAASVHSAAAFPLGDKNKNNHGDPFADRRKLTPAQIALIDKAAVRETVITQALQERTPIVETYIQNMRPDRVMGQEPDSDVHFLGRVSFGKAIGETTYATKDKDNGKLAAIKHPLNFLSNITQALRLSFHGASFVEMLLVDSDSFNRETYEFSYVRNDFLGTIPTVVFDVRPIKKNASGHFIGRIWVERNNGNIVRFNGDFAGNERDSSGFYHFDSWRTNVQEGLWLPTSVYIEESDPKSAENTLKFKAINYIWGYSLKVPTKETDQTDLEVLGAIDASQQPDDISPLQAQRRWTQQAEDNIIDRLYVAGLVDAPSEFDKTLEALANNILAYNNIPIDRPLKVRTLLTEPLESLAVGDTILLSKSLIDTTAIQSETGAQQMGNLNALLAFQIAHIILGHHIDTKYAFSDRLMFSSEAAFQRLPMHHTDQDNVEATKKAIELLNAKELADGQPYFGLYLQQLKARMHGLKALTEPQIGDSLIGPDGNFWMQALVAKGPKLNNTDLKQQAAMPLGSFLRFDPWTDQVIQMHTAYTPLLTPQDKLPFEVTPVYLKLSYWRSAAASLDSGKPSAAEHKQP
jgi:hypothetical protein